MIELSKDERNGRKVLALLGVQISNDTIQCLYDRIEFIDNPDVEEIGFSS